MEIEASVDAAVAPGALYDEIEDLAGYPGWLEIVRRAEPAEPVEGDEGPAWDVELQGRIGPLARSKRLRMVRTRAVPGGEVRFERRERDGRDHAAWVLDGQISPRADGSRLTMRLRYAGGFGGALVERILRDEIERAGPRLVARVEAPGR